MGRKNLDWGGIKKEYFEGEEIAVKPFLEKRYGITNPSTINKATKGWRKQKELLKKELLEEAVKKAKQNAELEKLATSLIQSKKELLEEIIYILKDNEKPFTIDDMPKLKIAMEMIKRKIHHVLCLNLII